MNEARSCNICITLSYLSTSQGRALETTLIATTITSSLKEMGTHIYRFRGWIAKVSAKSRCNMGYCGSTYPDGAFIAYTMTYLVEYLSRLYIQHVVNFYGVPVTIVSD